MIISSMIILIIFIGMLTFPDMKKDLAIEVSMSIKLLIIHRPTRQYSNKIDQKSVFKNYK